MLGAIHFLIWWKIRSARASLGFSVLAAGVAAYTWSGLAVMRADTAQRFFDSLWWLTFAVFVVIVGLVVFVSAYLRTARPWLGHLTWIMRFVTVVVNVWREPSFVYDHVTAMRPTPFLGETVYVVDGVTSPWFYFGQLSLVTAFVFLFDASYSLWRVGNAQERSRALTVGGAASVFMLVAWLLSLLTFRGVIALPHLEFLPFVGLLAVMGYNLGTDVIRAARLAGELQASEAAARELSGRLITAQEDERRRLARDLHDDLSQRLSVLSVELELFGRGQSAEEKVHVERLAATVRELGAQVHGLSYQLHPAKLDQLGLETAARSWCREMAQQSGIRIDFSAADVPAGLPPDVALCFYRIVQEALRNVVRHSGADAAQVELTYDGGLLRLAIVDAGRGFDRRVAREASGLGLLSMRERVQIVGGILEVDPQPGRGTRLTVTIPWQPDGEDAAAGSRTDARSVSMVV